MSTKLQHPAPAEGQQKAVLLKYMKDAWELGCMVLAASCFLVLKFSLICYAQSLFVGEMNISYMQNQEFIVLLISLSGLDKELPVWLWSC